MTVPRYLRADVERGFVMSYYQHVCRCSTVLLDLRMGHPEPWVAAAVRGDRVWLTSARLLAAVAAVREAAVGVNLVTVEQVRQRLRETVLAVPKGGTQHAFAQAALLIREALGLAGQPRTPEVTR